MRPRLLASLVFAVAALAAAVVLWPAPAHTLIASHQCSFCHNLHDAAGDQLLSSASVEVLCLTCHGPAGISVLKADIHKNDTNSSYPAFTITCRQCHDAHDNVASWTSGTNIKLVGPLKEAVTSFATISTPNSGARYVVFQSRGSDAGEPTLHSFADADEDGNGYYDGVCETCHTLTKFHRNNASGGHSHNTGRTCTNCHAHTTFFQK